MQISCLITRTNDEVSRVLGLASQEVADDLLGTGSVARLGVKGLLGAI
jgi:hypothetical protein